MDKKFKTVITGIVVIVALVFIYRIVFIRTVNYEIGGIKIPSEYNALTGKVRPISDYRGADLKNTIKDRQAKNIGLSEEQVVVAQLRWAVFEEWANSHSEYKGWTSNAETFKKAHDDFRKELESRNAKFRIVR